VRDALRDRSSRAAQDLRARRDSARTARAEARTARAEARAGRASARREKARREAPYLALVRSPVVPNETVEMKEEITVATYNVHRWTGINGRRAPDPARAAFVISELDADVVALQEVIRPAEGSDGEDPLGGLADELGMHLAFAVTRQHRTGQLGNAILSRVPIAALSVLDISYSRIERRGALAALFEGDQRVGVVATHLSLVDRTRHRQVASLLEHPQLMAGPTILMGDMNAWRKCKASRTLDDELERHHNLDWPASFPSARPMLALDRIYSRGCDVQAVWAHDTPASRRASDHLPVVASVRIKPAA